ncbi:hypothetical protein NE237_020314 [Protea cynaroides]|uniref:At3g05675-like ankyrin-like domain-containing protein n=1 Tax=Protea cynaroides TaxID=273540 RepID=A0A9Q0H704_9MAGN|nr:hypothetical protein NE237_020314 [Protea cynaroides]
MGNSNNNQCGKVINAERRLLANALLDFSNERFVLLSETCIPLLNFATVYTYLINSNHSFLGSFDDPRRADEHYLPTLVAKLHLKLNSNRSLTWVDWTHGCLHPKITALPLASLGRVEKRSYQRGQVRYCNRGETVYFFHLQNHHRFPPLKGFIRDLGFTSWKFCNKGIVRVPQGKWEFELIIALWSVGVFLNLERRLDHDGPPLAIAAAADAVAAGGVPPWNWRETPGNVHRYEVRRVTARLFVGIGKGQLLASKEVRCLLLQTWLEPFYDDFGWMRRVSKGLDQHLIEDGLSNTIKATRYEDEDVLLGIL